MSGSFHADSLSHGFFQFTKPFTFWGWFGWSISIICIAIGGILALVSTGIPDAPPVDEALYLPSPESEHEMYELGAGFEAGATGAWLRFDGTIVDGTIATGHCSTDDEGNWDDHTSAVDRGPLTIRPNGGGVYPDYVVRWTEETTGPEMNAVGRSCPQSEWTIGEGDYVKLFVLDDGETLWLFSAGEDYLEPSEVTDREDIQRWGLVFCIVGSILLMATTPTSLAQDIHNSRIEHSAREQMHLELGTTELVKAVGAERQDNDTNDWVLNEPAPESWNIENPYAADENDVIIEEHPSKIGTPEPATLTFYSIAAIIFITSTVWLSSDLLARHGDETHYLIGQVMRWSILIFNLIWAIISYRRWKVAHNILDTPTQLARSVAVGPAELVGQVRPGPLASLLVSVKSEDRQAGGVVAYSWIEEQYVCRGSGKNRKCSWETRDKGEGSVPFILHDGSAGILVDPSTWKKIDYGSQLNQWKVSNWRWTLHTLGIGDPIYCLGRAETKRDGEYEEELDRTQQSSLLVMRGNADVGMSVKLHRGTELSLLAGMRSTTEQLFVPVVLLILGFIPFLW